MNPRVFTILHSADNWASARKTYDIDEGQLVKVRDYHLGTHYTGTQFYLKPDEELRSLWSILLQFADDPKSFAIYGRPPEGVELFKRSSEGGLQDPGPQHLIRLDADGWETHLPWTYEDPASIRRVLHDCLKRRDLEWLATHDCLLLWSQSAWDTSIINAHLYYWSETGFALEQLRQWANALRLKHNYKVIDGAVYRAAQPDYIAKREIRNGDDPLTERIRFIKGDQSGMYNIQTFEDGITEVVKSQEGVRSPDGLTVEGFDIKGDAWEILKQCGKGDINEYAYRAAARLVTDRGKRNVRANIDALAEQMHDAAWSVIADNSDGERGSQKDRETYGVRRFKQYLMSACDNTKGGPDELADLVQQAITKAEAGEFDMICDKRVLKAFDKLRRRPEWQPFLLPLKRQMSARTIGMSYKEFVQQVDRSMVARANTDALLDDPDVSDETAGLTDMAICRSLEQAIVFHKSPTGQIALVDLHQMKNRNDGGYNSNDSADGVAGVLLAKARELFPYSDSLYTLDRAVGSMARLFLHNAKEQTDTRPHVAWSYRTPDGVLWQNLGKQDGKYRCLRIDSEASKRMTWQESYYIEDAPIWKRTDGVDTGTFNNGPHPFTKEDVAAQMKGRGERDAGWARLLFKHVRVQSVLDQANTIGFIVGELMDAPNGMIMTLQGVTGSGKSHTAMRILDLIHPVPDDLVDRHPHLYDSNLIDSREFLHAISDHKAIGIDNMSGTLKGKHQDVLCSVATGVRHRQRILYAQTFLNYFIRCSVILTGISDVTSREDLGTRTITVNVRSLDEGSGYTDRSWAEDRAEILSGLNRLACRVLCVLKDHNNWGRNLIQDTAMHIYYGDGFQQVREIERISGHAEGITRSPFAMAMAAFLEQNGVGLLGPDEVLSADLYEDFLDFCNDNRGEHYRWITPQGIPVRCDMLPQADKTYMPRNAKAFGIHLMKHVNSITALTGRRIVRKRTRWGTALDVRPSRGTNII